MSALSTKLRKRCQGWFGRFSHPTEVERAEQIFYLSTVQDGMIIFDVGANIGELTLLFSRFTPHGQVHAFEATQRGFQQLTAVCEAAGRSNIVLNHAAVADTEGVVPFHVYDDEHLSWSSLANRPLENYGISIPPPVIEEVQAVTIDGYCEHHAVDRIDLLKVDVEGAEYQVLLGAHRMLASKRVRCLAFEFGQATFDMGNSPDQIENYLKTFGYRIRNVARGEQTFPGRRSVQEARFSVLIATPR